MMSTGNRVISFLNSAVLSLILCHGMMATVVLVSWPYSDISKKGCHLIFFCLPFGAKTFVSGIPAAVFPSQLRLGWVSHMPMSKLVTGKKKNEVTARVNAWGETVVEETITGTTM